MARTRRRLPATGQAQSVSRAPPAARHPSPATRDRHMQRRRHSPLIMNHPSPAVCHARHPPPACHPPLTTANACRPPPATRHLPPTPSSVNNNVDTHIRHPSAAQLPRTPRPPPSCPAGRAQATRKRSRGVGHDVIGPVRCGEAGGSSWEGGWVELCPLGGESSCGRDVITDVGYAERRT